jgi:hypothetical protein
MQLNSHAQKPAIHVNSVERHLPVITPAKHRPTPIFKKQLSNRKLIGSRRSIATPECEPLPLTAT